MTSFFQRHTGLKKILLALVFVFIGLVIGFPVFSLTYFTMVRTSTPEFCASCHEIQFAYNTWKTSSHANNNYGFVADCMDCHLPAPQDTFKFFYSKTFHGIKDIVLHYIGEEYDHDKMREKVYKETDNSVCLKCHRNLLQIPYDRGAMLAHRSVIYAREGYEKGCLDCHRDLVHNPKPLYEYHTHDRDTRKNL